MCHCMRVLYFGCQMHNVKVAFQYIGGKCYRAGAVAPSTTAQLTKFLQNGPPGLILSRQTGQNCNVFDASSEWTGSFKHAQHCGGQERSRLLEQRRIVQERWLDPDCEYARPIDPTSSYVPTGPADIFAADRKARDGKKMNGHSTTAGTSQNGVKTNGHDFFNHRGERVHALSQHLPCT